MTRVSLSVPSSANLMSVRLERMFRKGHTNERVPGGPHRLGHKHDIMVSTSVGGHGLMVVDFIVYQHWITTMMRGREELLTVDQVHRPRYVGRRQSDTVWSHAGR